MAKLKLDPESLRVETFTPAATPTARGTIAARAESGGGVLGGGTCVYHCTFRGPTCDFASCDCPLTSAVC